MFVGEMKQSVLFDYEPQQLEGDAGSAIREQVPSDESNESSSLSWSEIFSLRWSLWLSSFAAINLVLFQTSQIFFEPNGMAENSGIRGGTTTSVFSVLLLLLAFSVTVALWKEWVAGKSSSRYPYGANLVLVSLASIVTLLSIKQVFLWGLMDEFTQQLCHQSVWILFCAAWFVAFREKLYLSIRGIVNGDEQLYGENEELRRELSGDHGSRLTAGNTVPYRMQVTRGLCLIRPRAGGKSETPLLRQAGDELPAGALMLKGTVEGTRLRSEESNPAQEWVSVQANHFLKEEDADVLGSYRVVQAIFLGLAVAALSWLMLQLFGGVIAVPLELNLVLGVFALAPAFELILLWSGLRNGFARRFFESGVVIRDFRIFQGLRKVQTVVFRIGSQSPLIGSAVVRDFQLIDERIDLPRLFGIVFGILRNSEDPFFTAVRDYCFECSPRPELFRIEEEESERQLMSGSVQGAQFLVGTEDALLEHGIHLEVSEAFYEQADFTTRLYLAVGNEVVGSFLIEPPFFAEMPKLIQALRKQHIRPILEGIDVDPVELDELGETLGFELVDIRDSEVSESKREEGEEDTLYVLLSPEEGQFSEDCGLHQSGEEHDEQAPVLAMTWFRETLWNVSFPGILLVNRRISPVRRLIVLSRLFYWMRAVVAILAVLLVLGGVLTSAFGLFEVSQVFGVVSVTVISLLALYRLMMFRTSPAPSHV
ncbi:cation-translocating P-type ATPase [bacterium]|nr:cation-translocating P-type ATPase [bacterium]